MLDNSFMDNNNKHKEQQIYFCIVWFRFLEKEETIFDRLMNGLIDEASNVAYVGNLSGFAKGESNLSGSDWVLRALVQCRQDIVGVNCELCLRQALRQRDGWNTPMVFLPSCYIQFDLYPYAHLSPHSKGIKCNLKYSVF